MPIQVSTIRGKFNKIRDATMAMREAMRGQTPDQKKFNENLKIYRDVKASLKKDLNKHIN